MDLSSLTDMQLRVLAEAIGNLQAEEFVNLDHSPAEREALDEIGKALDAEHGKRYPR